MTQLPRTVTVPIFRRKELGDGRPHAFIVQLNAERNVEAIAWHPDSSTNGAWELLQEGDELMLPPTYAEAFQRARLAAGDPDTATWASRLVMALLTPFLQQEGSK